jgi:glycosyltransferase involved in cell wall biosynthesis
MDLKNRPLSWSLIIPTYNRRSVLLDALRSAVDQTRKPKEIIVVDSSADAAETKQLVEEGLATKYPDIVWKYIISSNRSSAIQRNEGLDCCTGDIVFFMDDDCLMYSDYAAILMSVFDADPEGIFAGLQGSLTEIPPDAPETDRALVQERRSFWSRARNRLYWFWVNHIILNTTRGLFYPYWGTFPSHELPKGERVRPIRHLFFLGGGRAAYRSQVIQDVRFDPDLLHYATAEDLDTSFRASFRGALAEVPDAEICHRPHPSARPSLYVITLMAFTNHALWIQKHNGNSRKAKGIFLLRMLRHIPSKFVFDLSERRWDIPRVRGVVGAFPTVFRIFQHGRDNLGPWYQEFQKKSYEKHMPSKACKRNCDIAS